MNRHRIPRLALLALLAAPTSLSSQDSTLPSDLPALLAQAEERNPAVRAAARAAEAAAARVPRAGALPDPTLSVGVMNFPVADPSFARDPMTMTTVRLGERFPWPGKRGLREEVARFEAEAAEWEAERVRREVVADVKAAYYRIYFLDRALEVTARNEGLVHDLARLTSAKYGVGDGAQPDVLRAQVERTRLQDQLAALREGRVGAVARLNALLARPTDDPLPATELPGEVRIAALRGARGEVRFASASLADLLPEARPALPAPGSTQEPGLPSASELQRLALENSPTLQAHVRRVAARERALELAGKAKHPDLSVSAGYSRRAAFDDFVDVTVSVPLPLFAGRKQDREVDEERAVLAQHQAMHHTMVNELNAEIEALVADLRRARRQLVLLNEGILPQARNSLSSATASYRVGSVDFLTLLDAQVTLYRHELDHHRLLADFAENLAKLERAVGTEVLR